MCDVVEKMLYQVPHRLLGFQVFLTAEMTIPAYDGRLAIQAIFFLSFFKVRHRGIFLAKNKELSMLLCIKTMFFSFVNQPEANHKT